MKIALSPSRIKDLECPYLFQQKHITKSYKEPETPQMRIGHETHTFIAEYAAHCLQAKASSDPDYFWGKFDKLTALGKWTDPERARELVKMFIRSECSNLHVPTGSDWVLIEKQMCFDEHLNALRSDDAWFDTSGKTAFRLIVDYAYRQGEMIRVIDHKTGRKAPDAEQLEIYAALIPRYVPALDMGGVGYVEPQFNLLGGFKPEVIRLEPLTLHETAKGLEPIKAIMAEVNTWPGKYQDMDFPAIPCSLCERCGVPTCAIKKEVITSIEQIPDAPVFRIPVALETAEQAQKAVTFVTFLGQLEKRLKDLLKTYVDKNGPIVSGGMQAAYSEAEAFEIPDMQALIDLLSAFGATPNQILDALSMNKTSFEKLIKKAGLKERLPMIEQLTVSKISRRFNVKKAA